MPPISQLPAAAQQGPLSRRAWLTSAAGAGAAVALGAARTSAGCYTHLTLPTN